MPRGICPVMAICAAVSLAGCADVEMGNEAYHVSKVNNPPRIPTKDPMGS